MKLLLNEPFKSLWAGRDPFVAVEALQGVVYRELEGRRTLRTEVDGRGYFVKIHRGIGWGEIVKNLLTAKLPVLGATQELLAIERLTEVGVATMTAVAFGARGSNPAQQHSFIVTEELAPTISLEDFSLDWVKQPPPVKLKRALISEVAKMVGGMHGAAARGQHWVNNDHGTSRNILREVRVIVDGQFCIFVALNTNMSNACFGKEPQNSIGHAKASAQNRHHGDLAACDLIDLGRAAPAFNRGFLEREVGRRLIRQQTPDFARQLAKLLGRDVGLAHQTNLVFDEGVLDFNDGHDCALLGCGK